MAVRGALQRADGKIKNIDEVIAELIEFLENALRSPKEDSPLMLRIF